MSAEIEKALILTITYGLESCTDNEKQRRKIVATEMIFLRRIDNETIMGKTNVQKD